MPALQICEWQLASLAGASQHYITSEDGIQPRNSCHLSSCCWFSVFDQFFSVLLTWLLICIGLLVLYKIRVTLNIASSHFMLILGLKQMLCRLNISFSLFNMQTFKTHVPGYILYSETLQGVLWPRKVCATVEDGREWLKILAFFWLRYCRRHN